MLLNTEGTLGKARSAVKRGFPGEGLSCSRSSESPVPGQSAIYRHRQMTRLRAHDICSSPAQPVSHRKQVPVLFPPFMKTRSVLFP